MAASSCLGLLRIGAHSLPTERRRWRRDVVGSTNRAPHTFNCLQEYFPKEQLVHLKANLYGDRVEELKQRVRKTLCSGSNLTSVMTSIDTLQRLGIGYQFEEEISVLLDRCYDTEGDEVDLFSTALRFRLLRQGGYNATPEVFHKFLDSRGKFRESLSNDFWGLLSLHEASYLGGHDQEILSQAMVFSKHHLQTSMRSLDYSVANDVDLAMVFPRQRRMARSEAKSYIENYGHLCGHNSDLLELATSDFNLVQSLHQQEIEELVSWWRNLGLPSKLTFARDRPLECFLWTVGIFPEPCFSRCRIEVAKTIAVLLVIDDLYDSYGSLDELVLFTDAIKRWGIDAMENLPEYMKICYMALYNTTNEIGYRVLKEHGWFVVPRLRKTWIDLCEAFLVEARWFSNGIVPDLEDYLSNGVTTGGTYMALVHAFYLIGRPFNGKASSYINSYPKLFTSAGRILRLWDDLGTARAEQERGDVASSIECYMEHNGSSSEDEARAHVRWQIQNSWQDLNDESLAATSLSRPIANASLNLARTAQSIYQHGDDNQVPSIDDHIQSLFIKPIAGAPRSLR